ncbi:hypothetical protein DENSPDRAFT_661922 [Dentipellis sp. KUC8613]|nr:hypothetical protein DENSPDRAFT_661922 [Dentipellis sp. KUC8613]
MVDLPERIDIAQSQAVSYSEVACVVLLTYDTLITFSDEVEYIWKRQWTHPKVFYILARYIPLLVQLALLALNVNGSSGLHWVLVDCRKWMILQASVLQITITTVDAILLLRVYALYNRSRALMGTLIPLFLAEIVILCVVLARITPRITYNQTCFVTGIPFLFTAYWITSLVFETLLFSLTVHKFVLAVRDGWGRRPVMRRFVTDGTWAFTLIFLTMLVNALLYALVHTPLAGICFTWLLSVLSFAGSRLLLNPRRFLAPPPDFDSAAGIEVELDVLPSPLSPASPRSPAKAGFDRETRRWS